MSTLDWLPPSILRLATHRDLKSREVLPRQGDAVSATFEVEEGRIRLLRNTIDAHVAVLHAAANGESFAEAALFSDMYHCDAIASVADPPAGQSDPVLLNGLAQAHAWSELYRRDPALPMAVLRSLRTRLRSLRNPHPAVGLPGTGYC